MLDAQTLYGDSGASQLTINIIGGDNTTPANAPGTHPQGLRIKIERMDKIEKPALESDFDQYPEKPGDFLNIATQYDINHNIKLLL